MVKGQSTLGESISVKDDELHSTKNMQYFPSIKNINYILEHYEQITLVNQKNKF